MSDVGHHITGAADRAIRDRGEKVLAYGDDALSPAQGRKRPPKKPAKRTLIITARHQGYGSPAQEVTSAKSGLWFPHATDFTRTASLTKGPKVHNAAGTADEFFGALQGLRVAVSRVVYIGHGSPGVLGLGGRPGDFFGETLDAGDVDRWKSTIDSDIRPNLQPGATLDLLACNQAVGGELMQDLASALQVTVRGFDSEVYWCLGFTEPDTITSRGRIATAGSAPKKPCDDQAWVSGVHGVNPPVTVAPA